MTRALFLHRDLLFHGGVPKCILYFARGCDRARVEVHVASFKAPSREMVRMFGDLGIRPVCLGDNGYLGPAATIRRLVVERNIDVIVCNSLKSYLAAKLANVGLGKVVLMWVHAIYAMLEGPARQLVYQALVRHDPIVYVSKAVQRANAPKLHLGPSAVIYNGVNDPMREPLHLPYPQSERTRLGVPADAVLFSYMAEFIPWKNHATLLRAFERLDPERHNAHLLLIGTGQTFGDIRRLAQTLSCGRRIHFLGPRTDGRRIVGMSDIYVHPSKGEGFGLAVVEAMLASRPVIVANDGACVEYVHHGHTGLTYRLGVAEDLAAKMARLAGDPALRRQLGEAGRDYCLTHFPMERYIETVCNLLESLTVARQAG